VYGSSYGDEANWIGRPVQWIGLLYAYSLQHLAAQDRSFPWLKVARGITVSALYQQAYTPERGTEANRKGAYPDSIDGVGYVARPGFRDPLPAWIEPDYILLNLLALEGRDPEVHTRAVWRGDASLHVSSGARLGAVDWDEPAGVVTVVLERALDDSAQTAVAGLPRPVRVAWEGSVLPEVDRLGPADTGWLYDAKSGLLCLKTRFDGPQARLQIRVGER
jgi:hypothetical protein